MPKLILTRGIPASGKSTWAKQWVQEDPQNRTRVNRDDLRHMLYATDSTLLAYEQEQHVSAVEKAIAKTALSKGKDVVVDAMNLRARWVRQWFTLGYDVEFKDFPTTLTDALARNATRDNPLPAEVIEKTFQRLTRAGELPKPDFHHGAVFRPYTPDESLPAAYIFDIDGTLAHMTGRSPYDYTRVGEDRADESVVHLLKSLAKDHRIVIMSGRDAECRGVTEAWLAAKGIGYTRLIMRSPGDKRQDATVKHELFNQYVADNYNVRGVIDDRNQVVAMWRDMGLKCFQAQEGDF